MNRSIMIFAAVSAALCAGSAQAQVRIVSVYEGMASYAEAMAADSTPDRDALWREKVIDPYWELCAEGSQYLDYGPSLTTPVADIEGLKAAAHALRASSVEATVRAAIEKASSILPGPATTVCILAADPEWTYLRDLHGVGGFTAGAGKIWLTILPEGDWTDWLTYGIAHEYHHSVWMAAPRELSDMADYLVFEGQADSFARLVDPQRQAPWTNALVAPQERAAWQLMERHIGATDAETMRALMFGGVDDVPRWAGYTIGFRMVQAFLGAHPELTVSQWTAIPTSEFIGRAFDDPEHFPRAPLP